MRRAAIGMALALTGTVAAQAVVTPLDWPDAPGDDSALALHCAAVMTAFGLAYVAASELARTPEPLPVGTLPAHLLERAGGPDRLGEIRAQAEAWTTHSESVAVTHFYPRLSGEGTPYLADEGRELVQAVERCAERFGL